MTRRLSWGPAAALAVATAVPFSTLTVPGVFDAPLNGPGTLQVLALCLVFAAVAQSYDLLFGHTGLLSFGHALFFACGVYTTTILVTMAGWPVGPAAVAGVLVATTLAAVIGAVAVRASGVAFAMVTLAFAQVGAIVVARNPGGLTGGTDGLALDANHLPDLFVGVANTVNLYWLALAYLVLTSVLIGRVLRSPGGRVLSAIRDNQLRVTMLGIPADRYKRVVYVFSAALAAGAGAVYALVAGGASPHTTSTDLTLSLLIMVVVGGSGSRWGAVIGAVLYTYLDHRLTGLAASGALDGLPRWLAAPLTQPQLLLGVAFIVLVIAAPGGLAARRPRIPPARGGGRVPAASAGRAEEASRPAVG
jgi:branched-chain amino acid transport system permease protein